GLSQDIGATFLLIFRGPRAGENSKRRMKWASHEFRLQSRRPFNEPFEPLHSRMAKSRVRSDRVGFGSHQTDGCAGKAQVVEFLADLLVMLHITFKDRDFHALVADLLQFGQDWEMVPRDMRRPQQQIHAGLHEGRSRLVRKTKYANWGI